MPSKVNVTEALQTTIPMAIALWSFSSISIPTVPVSQINQARILSPTQSVSSGVMFPQGIFEVNDTIENPNSAINPESIILEFVKNLAANSAPVDEEISKIVSQNFWNIYEPL